MLFWNVVVLLIFTNFFQAAKRSDMGCVEVQWSLFADFQEWHFQAAKFSYKINTTLQEAQFAHSPE